MNAEPPVTFLALPDELPDEVVAQLLECLYELARGIENHYVAQLLRYHHRPDQRQQSLWPDNDPPF